MNRNITRIFLSIIVIACIFFIANVTYASFSVTDLTGTQLNNADLTNSGNKIITILTTIGSVVSVIVLIVIGLKYMMGSIEEKAQYKKTMMPYVIGAALVFAASAIAGMIYSFSINIGG